MTNTLPKEFWERVENIYSKEDAKIIAQGFETEKRKPTFRVNTIKSNIRDITKILNENNLEFSKVDYLDNCYTLENGNEKTLWDLDIFTKGMIYMQQTTSQIPVAFLDLGEGKVVLDVTAAPGSKTSQIATKLRNTGSIIAVDNNSIRIDKLNFTLKRQGSKNVHIIKTDARTLSKRLGEYLMKQGGLESDTAQYFDNILFDAPCSAEGRINYKNEKTYGFWRDNMYKRHYKLSKSILEEVIPMLKKGGTLVFSTCTLAPEENEAIAHFILSNYPDMELEPVTLDAPNARPGLKSFGKQIFRSEVVNTLRMLPSEETEGFFIAKFKKKLI